MLENLRELTYKFNVELLKNNLVSWTSGNVSVRDPYTNLIIIKPSGVKYEELSPEKMVIVNLDGEVVEGNLKPSSDTASHCYIYKHRNDVFGIAHTHSNYATAFAAVGRSIPIYLTAQADEFGCEIPCAPFALIGGEEIGKFVVEYIGASKAILLKNHGVFTIGTSGEEAVKAAVMLEDIAKTIWLALQIDTPQEIPLEEIEKLNYRYKHFYGQ
ncbi:TPA: L-ribulose-5-phosphate 4-epimerase [Candidatus Poribacteria bacterium]|nr:L-ribulose-5-phosphate 4-epimerase [Candidatus Poribacteria bacterium]